jgi:hypothetical protein
MSRTFRYAIAPGYGPKNSMAASDTIRVVIPVNKDEIYEDARVMLHKFGDARLTAENEYHIHVVQADDMDEDTRLFDRYYARAYKDAVMACMAYYHGNTTNTGSHISITPPETRFPRQADITYRERVIDVESNDDWTLQLTNDLAQQADNNEVEYLYAIGLMMPTTWQEEVYETLCDNVYDYILFSIVADFLKVTEPREYGFYKEEAVKYRIYIKDALEARKPFTRYTEIKPY